MPPSYERFVGGMRAARAARQQSEQAPPQRAVRQQPQPEQAPRQRAAIRSVYQTYGQRQAALKEAAKNEARIVAEQMAEQRRREQRQREAGLEATRKVAAEQARQRQARHLRYIEEARLLQMQKMNAVEAAKKAKQEELAAARERGKNLYKGLREALAQTQESETATDSVDSYADRDGRKLPVFSTDERDSRLGTSSSLREVNEDILLARRALAEKEHTRMALEGITESPDYKFVVEQFEKGRYGRPDRTYKNATELHGYDADRDSNQLTLRALLTPHYGTTVSQRDIDEKIRLWSTGEVSSYDRTLPNLNRLHSKQHLEGLLKIYTKGLAEDMIPGHITSADWKGNLFGTGINIPKKDFIEEHVKLLEILNKGNKKARKREAKDQAKELSKVLIR